MKQNDWIVANINNPDFTAGDFKNVGGLSLENTLLLPMESYLKSNKILENDLFKDSNGEFSKDKFEDYYMIQASKFNSFAQDSALDNYEYGFWDIFLKPDSRVHNPNFNIDKVANPTHLSTGVIGINLLGERTRSDFELAEKQKIYDWEKGKFIDETPEDSALFSNPFKFVDRMFSEPLVLAKYEEDGTHRDPFTGQLVEHRAGENKINEDGEYYFETLGGRSIQNKLVLSLGDIITKEDQAINKYDFFDSDDIEKSPMGVIVKNLTAIAPMAFLGPIGATWYSGFYVGRELLKTLPMLYSVGTMLSDEETPSMLNRLAGWGQSMTGSTSDYGRNNVFSFENFGNLISDVALQWGQLKFIINSLQKLSSSNKTMLDVAKVKAISEYERQAANIINSAEKGNLSLKLAQTLAGIDKVSDIKNMINEDKWASTLVGQKAIEKYMPEIEKSFANRTRLGLDLSLIYMAMISNTDVFESALEHGATKTEAAILSLGSMAGMFAVDKYAHLGEMFFDDEEAAAKRLYRQSLKESVEKDVKPVLQRLGGTPTVERESKSSLLNLFNKGKESTIKFLLNYKYDIKDRSLSILGKSIGEGLEEMSEEAVTDIVKSLYQLAYNFGITSQKNIGAWDNARDRYLMSLFGGAIGGGIFAGVDAIRNPKSTSDKNSLKELLHLVREGRTLDILKELEVMRDRGMLGNKELSINTTNSKEGNYFISADKDNISQNDFVYNQMKSAILLMDKIINGNQLNLTEDQLFERMLLSDIKLMHIKDFLKDSSYMSGYFNEYEKIVLNIYNNEVKILELEATSSDPSKRNSEDYKQLMENLLLERQKWVDYKDEFFKNKSQRYLKKTIFGTNANISGALLPMTYNQYVQLKYGKEEQYLSEAQKSEAKNLYDKYVKTKKLKDFDEAFEAWDNMTKKINPTLQGLDLGEIEIWEQATKELDKFMPKFGNVNYDERVKPLDINTERELKFLHVIRTPEYDKPWKDNPTKSNKAFDLQLEERPDLFFLIVKDEEDNYWSIHFKTDNAERSNENPSYSALNDNLKQRLFRAAALVIPEGDFLSTHGELTPGGVSGMNRFGQRDFLGQIRFIKTGERNVKTKNINEFEVKVSGTTEDEHVGEGKYVGKRNSDGSWEINHEGNSVSQRGMTREEMDSKGISIDDIIGKKEEWTEGSSWDETAEKLKSFKVDNIVVKSDGSISIKVSDNNGNSFEVEKDSAKKLYDNLFSDFNVELYNSQDIKIPVWLKNTGETDEEYENRNNKLEGETEELFEERKRIRLNRLIDQYELKQYEILKKLEESDATIDTNTYRLLVVQLGRRAKDIKITSLRNLLRNSPYYSRIQEILEKLDDDFSNKDEIWNQVQEILHLEFDLYFIEKVNKNELPVTILPKELQSKEFITLNDILDYYIDNFSGVGMWTNTDEMSLDPDRMDLDDASVFIMESSDIDKELKDDIRNLFNIRQYLDNPTPEGFKLYGAPIVLADGTTFEGTITNTARLLELEQAIKSKYNGGSDGVLYNKKSYDDRFNKYFSFDKDNYYELIDDIQNNIMYSTLLKLPSKIESKNRPTLKLLKSISDKIGVDFSDIESTLLSIVERYNELSEASDFRLSDSQINALENAFNLIELAKAAIIAASGTDTYFTPWNYNKTINEWNKAHKSEIDGEIDELPELDENVSNVLLQDLYQYLKEINLWIKRARQNGINKVKMFEQFDNKFETVKLKFVMDNRHKMKLDDGTDLLEGFNEVINDPKESVLEFEKVFYANVQKALKNGKSEEDLFKIFDKIINFNEAIKLKTSKLDLNLTELTDYDKFIYLISCMNYNPDNFYSDYKSFVESNKDKIAPLSFLKHAIRIIKSQLNNPEFINKMLDLFKDKTNFNGAILYNTSIVTGIGGSGKTSVVARGVVSDTVILSGPTDELNVNLKSNLGNFEAYNKEELLKFILESQYDKFNDELKLNKSGELLKFVKKEESGNLFDVSKVTVKKLENAPKLLIIDEATLFSNAELQVISKFCKENEINLVLAGDENLNSDMSIGWNLQRENTLSVRVPKLGMSLRETNLWKYLNYDTLQNLEDSLRDTDEENETKLVKNRLVNTDLKKYKLKYYLKDKTFFGDMISSGHLSQQQLDAIKEGTNLFEDKNKRKICFVGSTSSDVYQLLQTLKIPIEVKSVKEVQGHEYPYVIVDLDWKELSKNINKDPESLLNFMLVLYTMLTRSLNGTIFIDNGLTNIIGTSEELSYNAPTVNLDKNSISKFSEKELKWLNSHTWNPSNDAPIRKSTPINKEKIIEVKKKDGTIVTPVKGDNKKLEEKDNDTPVSYNQSLLIHTYTNFNYLGVNRRLGNDGKGIWFNDNDSHRDIGIFLRKGTELVTDEDKQLYVDKLLDLKSAILFDKLDASYASNPFVDVPVDNVRNAEYFIVREEYNPEIHHHITIELNLKELPAGTVFYTLQARFKGYDGNICTITLATLPDPSNMLEKIYKDLLERELNKIPDTEENKKLRLWYNDLLNNKRFFDDEFGKFKSALKEIDKEENKERHINKPNFVKMTGLRYIKDEKDNIYHLRLEEINSFKSRYTTRSSAYIISPIYASIKKGDNNAGKPFILVSADRSLSPNDLVDIYEEQLRDSSLPISVRQIMLDSMGVSFESLFDERYRDLFTTQGSKNGTYTFPFDLLPTGLRMYVALHNFRANLIKLNDKIKKKYPDRGKLTAIAQEESRLFLLHKNDGNPNLTNTEFKNWLNSNPSLILNGITLDDIKGLWDFNENELKGIKLFRIGYSSDSGVYIRNISSNYNGNYINPKIAETWLDTIQRIFDTVLDKIIPPESLANVGDITEISDYKKLASIEDTWVKNLEKHNSIVFTLKDDESDNDITLEIPSVRGIRAIPIVLCQIVKNLLARSRMSKSQLETKFKDYNTNPESHYAVKILNDEKEETFINYLTILDGELGEIGHKSDPEPGVRERKGLLYDLRLIDMFNVMFHGAVSLWENKQNRNDFLKDRKAHAEDVLFPYGFFVDPILGGKYSDTSDHAIVNTDIKFYATNMAPSGVKTFIDFRPYKEVEESKKVTTSTETPKSNNEEVLNLFNELSSAFGSLNWIKSGVKTKKDLIKEARRQISSDLNIYFGQSSDINSLDKLLNIPISIDENGKMIRIRDDEKLSGLSSSAIMELVGETFLITDGNIVYTISKNGSVKKDLSNINPITGLVELSPKGFVDYWNDFVLSEDNFNEEGEYLIMSIPPEIEGINGFDEITKVNINDDEITNLFKQKVKKILQEATDGTTEKINEDEVDNLLDNYINRCING